VFIKIESRVTLGEAVTFKMILKDDSVNVSEQLQFLQTSVVANSPQNELTQ